MDDYETGAVDVTIDSYLQLLFITYEGSSRIVWVNTKTLEQEGYLDLEDYNPSVGQLAGILADEIKQRVYVLERDRDKLYILSWDSIKEELALMNPQDPNEPYIEGNSFVTLENLDTNGAFGVSIYTNRLYVSNNTTSIHYYDTDTWSHLGTRDVGRNAMDIAVDPNNGEHPAYLYAGGYGPGGSHEYLIKHNLEDPNSGNYIEKYLDTIVIGLAVDPNSSLVYCTTSDNKVCVYDCSNPADPNIFIRTDYESEGISGPAGICVPTGDIRYKSPDLEIVKYDPNECLTPFDPNNFTEYTILVNTLDYEANNVIVTDTLPPEVIFWYADPNTGIYDPNTHTVTWHLGDLPANSLGQYLYVGVYVTSCAKPGSITNYVEVESDEFYNWNDWDTPICCWGGPIVYVDENAPGCNSGSSWQDAFTDLQDALDLIRDCPDEANEIWVADGTYSPGVDTDDTFQLIDDIALYGGFAGNESSKEQRNWNVHRTFLSGINTAENCNYVVAADGVNQTAFLDGFIIEGGSESGIYCLNATPTIANCLIQVNVDTGIYCDNADPNIIDCTVYHNWGNGIYCDQSDPAITNCAIKDNTKNGILCDNSEPVISQCVIKKNDLDGLFVENESSPLLYECLIETNGSDAIECKDDNSYLIVANCKIRSNVQHGVYLNSSSGTILNNWIHHNGNNGIKLSNAGANTNIRNNTIVYNHNEGIYLTGEYQPEITNCILWGNDNDGSSTQLYNCSATYCCIEGVTMHNGNHNIDNYPEFAYSDPDSYNFHLDPNSACIDAGDDTGIYEDETDIDGDPRIKDPNVDIGADECSCEEDVSHQTDFNGDGIVNLLDYTPLAAYWLTDDDNGQDPNWPDEYDLIADGEINLLDLNAFCNNWLWTACYYSNDWYTMKMMMSSGSGGIGFGKMSNMQSMCLTTIITPIQPQPKKLTEAELWDLIHWLEEIRKTDEDAQKIPEDEWQEFMKRVYLSFNYLE